MRLTSLLPEAYGTLSTIATVGATYLLWRFNPRRMRREATTATGLAATLAEVATGAAADRKIAEETHEALWGTPALLDDTGALIRMAEPGVLAQVQALRSEFPRNGKSARALMEEISQRQVNHQEELRRHAAELHEYTRASSVVYHALWTALLDSHGVPPQYPGPPAAPARGETL